MDKTQLSEVFTASRCGPYSLGLCVLILYGNITDFDYSYFTGSGSTVHKSSKIMF